MESQKRYYKTAGSHWHMKFNNKMRNEKIIKVIKARLVAISFRSGSVEFYAGIDLAATR